MEEIRQYKGHLKIFFGYAAGVGKTYTMVKAALAAKRRGVDVAVGYVDAHNRPQTEALCKGLEMLPRLSVKENGVSLQELDLDGAIRRKPQLILIDELAHTNASGCRHSRRYQDVLELLKAGIDVYTTVNVQHIESLNDTVASVTGTMVQERIPDFVFDDADQVELVDIEPQELIERMNSGKIYAKEQAEKAVENFFTIEKLTALREIALRRCADRVNRLTEIGRIRSNSDYHTDEHILVCLSPSPSNKKIIRTAARMANAFRGAFTAIFVETSDFAFMDEADKKRLRSNMHLAQQLGAAIETVYGEDVPFQIAEFARLSGVSKIVIGRSAAARRHLFGRLPLTEQLIANAPNVDVHIIPDQTDGIAAYRAKRRRSIVFSAADILKCVGILAAASGLGYLFEGFGFAEANIITVYVLAVLIISVVTVHRIYSLIAAIVSVLVFNFLFTVPKFTLRAYDQGYPVTFLIMFMAAFLTGTLAARMKTSAKQSARAAFRTKVLFDTNQLLQQAKNKEEIISDTAHQLVKLLDRDIIVYPSEGENLLEPVFFPAEEEEGAEEYVREKQDGKESCAKYAGEKQDGAGNRVGYAGEKQDGAGNRAEYAGEREVALWALKNNKHAGATTQTFSDAKCLYLAIRVNDSVYGVVGIAVGEQPLDAFENSILLSILGECALALENKKNAKEKEEAAILAKNEQLRANLLRAISHDLRTPLTSISGNASNLLSNGDSIDERTKMRVYQDIYDDSMWLINLVENLLSVTRLEEGRLNLNMSAELVDEVVQEALRHVNRLKSEHVITAENQDDLLLAKMDAKLIVQVLINLVDNAIKYTPAGSHIHISTGKEGQWAVISIADDGAGIPDENKKQVFDMFYSGANRIADSRRSLGLGLSLCKSIVNAHGGTISVRDNVPHGSVFTFSLPVEEVQLHE